jgi:DNA topoisomerase-3
MANRFPIELLIKDTEPPSGKRKKKKTATASTSRKRAPKPKPATDPKTSEKGNGTGSEAETREEAALRAWRLAEAKRRGVPAFRILSDRTLRALATSRPATSEDLLDVPGIGSSIMEKYGASIFRVLRETGGV